MPRVGSSRIKKRGCVASQRASSTFCWLPPLRFITACSGPGVRMPSDLDEFFGDILLPFSRKRVRGALARLKREDDIFAHRKVRDNAFHLAILRREGETLANGLPRRMKGHLSAPPQASRLSEACRCRKAGAQFPSDPTRAIQPIRRFLPCRSSCPSARSNPPAQTSEVRREVPARDSRRGASPVRTPTA